MASLRYLASSFGSAGDFLPTLAVAHELAKDGHEVLFVTNPFHETAVKAAGLAYVPTGELVDLNKIVTDNPDILSMTGGGLQIVEDLAIPWVISTYRTTREILRDGRFDAVIGSNLTQGVFWAAIERRVRSVMVSATPVFWLSRAAPAQFLDFEIPGWLLPHVAWLARTVGINFADHLLRSVSRTVGANAFDGSQTAIEAGVALHAGMWPELVRPRAPDDAPNRVASGFARAGHLWTTAPALSPELEAFLSSGEPPVVIALGSIFSLGSGALVADIAAACAELGRRCVVVGRPPRDQPLPEGTFVVPYATYHLVFPRAAAVVIHGGAGTTGEALKSGRPAVVVPLAFDQFGLAWQVERLGAGVRVPKRGRTREVLARALRTACEDEEIAARATEIAATLREEADGAERTARLITQLG